MVSIAPHSLAPLTWLRDTLVKEINGSNLETIYSYTGDDTTHEPIYYEETALFKKMLEETGLTCRFVEVSDAQFSPETWNPYTSIVHIPGAMSTSLDNHLGHKISAIKKAVETGMGFIGCCGGGFWACKETEYQQNSITVIHKTRELSLWNGKEIGPLLPYRGNPEGNIGFFHGAVKIHWVGTETLQKLEPKGLELNVLLSGGGHFVPAANEHVYRPLCNYPSHDKLLAGVQTTVGKGSAVLINPYFTHGDDYFTPSLEGYKEHFPDHDWDKLSQDLQEPNSLLKRMICFVDMIHAATPRDV